MLPTPLDNHLKNLQLLKTQIKTYEDVKQVFHDFQKLSVTTDDLWERNVFTNEKRFQHVQAFPTSKRISLIF